MTTVIRDGQTTWSMTRDRQTGHRTYNIQHIVIANTVDGPAAVMLTPGLPLTGSIWSFDNDIDSWAFCTPFMRIAPRVTDGDPNDTWTVDQTFSTKPWDREQDTPVEDPLLEPQRIKGSAVRYTTNPEMPLTDKDGKLIQSISFEPFRGLEFDANRHQVQISQNKAVLDLGDITQMVDTVNDNVLWGLPARAIKLSELSWERKYSGDFVYYVRNFGFDIAQNPEGNNLPAGVLTPPLWDRDIREEGTRVLRAGGNVLNRNDWVVHTDEFEHIDGTVLLDAAGAVTDAAGAQIKRVQFYPESDFLALGIPAEIGV